VLARIAAGLWGAMILGGLLLGAVGPDSWVHAVGHEGPGCPFRNATGYDCPFCGMTRATLAMGGGDFSTALAFHPLAPIVVIGMLALMVLIAIGRGDALIKGKRPWILLGSIGAIWILRYLL
jgi:hypothetical protein